MLTFSWLLIGFLVVLVAYYFIFSSTQKFFEPVSNNIAFPPFEKIAIFLGAATLLAGGFIVPNIPASAGIYAGFSANISINLILALFSARILWVGIDKRFTPQKAFETVCISLGAMLMLIDFLQQIHTYFNSNFALEMLLCGSVFVESILIVVVTKITSRYSKKLRKISIISSIIAILVAISSFNATCFARVCST